MTFDYFAYGSNMLRERLQHSSRCPGAEVLGTAQVENFRLAFSKRSIDRSGKATLVEAAGSGETVYGVLFRIPLAERDALDVAEGKGKGYERNDRFPVILSDTGSEIFATAYIAAPSECDDSYVPYDWYRDLALAGAFQNRLPPAYVEMLRQIRARPDPKSDRKNRVEALAVLKQAGFEHGIPPGQ